MKSAQTPSELALRRASRTLAADRTGPLCGDQLHRRPTKQRHNYRPSKGMEKAEAGSHPGSQTLGAVLASAGGTSQLRVWAGFDLDALSGSIIGVRH